MSHDECPYKRWERRKCAEMERRLVTTEEEAGGPRPPAWGCPEFLGAGGGRKGSHRVLLAGRPPTGVQGTWPGMAMPADRPTVLLLPHPLQGPCVARAVTVMQTEPSPPPALLGSRRSRCRDWTSPSPDLPGEAGGAEMPSQELGSQGTPGAPFGPAAQEGPRP